MKTAVLLALTIAVSTAQSPTVPAPAPGVDPLQNQLDRQSKQLRDWPNLARYRDANASLAPAAAANTRVVFMGDSITDAWGRSYAKFFPGKDYVNRGISGQTTPQMLIRFRPDVLALQPKVVVILAGTNDIAGNTGPETIDEIEGNLLSMVQLARANGIAVVLASLTPVSDDYHEQTAKRPLAQINTLNAWIRSECQKDGLTYLDYYSGVVDERGQFKKELTYDGLHPNDAGYAIMGPLAETAIESATGKL